MPVEVWVRDFARVHADIAACSKALSSIGPSQVTAAYDSGTIVAATNATMRGNVILLRSAAATDPYTQIHVTAPSTS